MNKGKFGKEKCWFKGVYSSEVFGPPLRLSAKWAQLFSETLNLAVLIKRVLENNNFDNNWEDLSHEASNRALNTSSISVKL